VHDSEILYGYLKECQNRLEIHIKRSPLPLPPAKYLTSVRNTEVNSEGRCTSLKSILSAKRVPYFGGGNQTVQFSLTTVRRRQSPAQPPRWSTRRLGSRLVPVQWGQQPPAAPRLRRQAVSVYIPFLRAVTTHGAVRHRGMRAQRQADRALPRGHVVLLRQTHITEVASLQRTARHLVQRMREATCIANMARGAFPNQETAECAVVCPITQRCAEADFGISSRPAVLPGAVASSCVAASVAIPAL